jgi:hypothetical protein
MYVTSVGIDNVRSVRQLEWEVDEAAAPGWHVILGENGAGKSSFLRSIALALIGPQDVYGLRQNPDSWLRKGELRGGVGVVFTRDEEWDRFATRGAPPRELGAYLALKRGDGGVSLELDENRAVRGRSLERTVWNADSTGWFLAGFGPFRRLTGGEGRVSGTPRLLRCLSLFDERFALGDVVDYLIDLFLSAPILGAGLTPAGATPAGVGVRMTGLFDRMREIVNQYGFLPDGIQLESVGSGRTVLFRDAAGSLVEIGELSDGLRSALALMLEVLRQLVIAWGPEALGSGDRIDAPGVVLIDEVDVHLHPTWQRRIGDWFTRVFPRIQFVVTTHSPLVCQGRTHSIFVLPSPGSVDTARFLTEAERRRFTLGNVLDAYGTGAFGIGVAQSDEGRVQLARLAELNAKELEGELDRAELAERDAIRQALPSRAGQLPASDTAPPATVVTKPGV